MAMYLEHFGLERPPFAMHPDPDFLYLSEQHSSAKAFLESSAFVNDSFVVITGSIGADKTTLVEGFLAELPPEHTVIARINQTQLSPTAFLRMLLDDLGLEAFKAKKPELLARLRKYLEECASRERRVVVLVDEAQNLSEPVLEEIRMLTGHQHASCLSVVLVGQPEFLQTLESPSLRQLAQRCRLRSELYALDAEETRGYILHRLAIAGLNDTELFTGGALDRIYDLSGGVPRLINSLCDTALICAFADEQRMVDKALIDAAARELKWQLPADTDSDITPDETPPAAGAENASPASIRPSTDTRQRAATVLAGQNSELEKALQGYQARLDDMHARLAAAFEDDALPACPHESDSHCPEAGAQLDSLVSGLQQIDDLLASLTAADFRRETSTDARDELAGLHQTIEQQQSLLERLRHDLADAKNSSTTEQSSLQLQQLLADLKKSEAQLSANLVDVTKDRDQLSQRLRDLDDSAAANTDRLTVLETKIASRNNSIRTLEDEVRRKNRLIDDLHDKLESLPALEQQTADLDQQNLELRAEIEARNMRIFELQEALSVSRQQLDEVRSELDSSQSSHVNLHKAVGELKARVSELKNGTSQRDDLVKSLQTECQNRKKDLRKLRSELDESLDQSRELRDSVEVGEARIQELEKELAVAMETISEMSESCSQASSEVRQFEQQLSTRQEELDVLQDELRTKDAELSSIQAELREKTETIKVLQMDTDGSDTVTGIGNDTDPLVTQLRGEVEIRGRRIEELEHSLHATAEKLDQATAELEKQAAVMLDLEEQLESSRMAAADLREELGEAGREFEETAVINDDSVEPDDPTARNLATEAGLLVNTNGRPTRRIPLRTERLIIGRTRDSDIRIDNEFASRHHAQIVYDKGHFVLEDLNSTNGIFVNSRRVKRRRLRNRDIISIGPDKMVFVLEQHTSH